ncbi:PKD domain-containing protein [Cellulomonas sp. NPDC057328]|uniref:PKD domain-containing protein n=1 Tax=Cellulomonas sp. NPDC057328 TaxID=3346101 RepID=UPI00362E9935
MHSSFRSTRGPVRAVAAAAVTAGVVVALSPTVASAAPRQEWPVLAADAFSRTTAGSWGSAENGGAWAHNGSAASYAVSGGVGNLVVPRAGSTIQSWLGTVASTDSDVSLTVAAGSAMTGSGAHLGVTARRVGGQEYAAKVRLLADGTATVALVDAGTVLPAVALPGTFAAGERIAVRVQASGTAPTTLRAKAWRAGQAEPADWTVSATSSTPALQAPGHVGVSAYLAGNVTNAPVTFGFDDLRVTTANPVAVPNTAPVAALDASTARKSLVARVDGSRSTDADGAVTAWAWSFGDGTKATGRTAEHTYAAAGTYTVSLTVTDDEGATATTTRPVTVTAPNVAPTAAFPAPAVDGLTASVDAGTSADADGQVASYAWSFGDGTTATGRTARHTFTAAGTYTVQLTVTDDDGATATTTRKVTVAAPAEKTVAATGRPNADTTGMPAGRSFSKVHEGNLVITQANTVIDGWDIRGYVTVKAANVTIRNSYIRGTKTPQAADLVRVQGDAYSVTIEDSTLIPQTKSANQDGVKGWNFTLRRVEIADVIDPVHIHGSNVLIEKSWLHRNAHYEQDPNWGGKPSHDDSIQLQKGANVTIRDNTIEGSHNAALMLTQDAGAVSKLSVTGNFIDGGACTINVKDAKIGAPTGVTIANNTFGRNTQYKNCSVRVPTAYTLDLRSNVYPDGVAVKRTNI